METSPCAVRMKLIHDKIERDVNNALREQNLTAVQMQVLLLLKCAKGQRMTLKEVEGHLQVSQPTAAGVVSRLEQKEFLVSKVCRDDRRVKILQLTEEGLRQCETAWQDAQKVEERIRDALGEEQYAQLGVLLGSVMDALGIVPCGKGKVKLQEQEQVEQVL